MDTLIHADIFFFITTIAVVLIALVSTVALVYFIRILKNVLRVSEMVKEETKLVREDLRATRQNMREDGFRLKHLISFFSNLSSKKPRSKKQ